MSTGTKDTERGLTVPSQRRRLGVSFGAAVVIGLAASPFLPWQAALLIGWDALAASYAARIWALITRLDGATTQDLATREDNSRTAADVLLVAASVASLVGSASLLVLKTSTNDNNLAVLLTIIAVGAVALAWAPVHTVFTLR